MSWLSDLGQAISNAADSAADAVESVVNTVEEVVTDVVETVGNVIEDTMNSAANAVDNTPVVGDALSSILRWGGNVISDAFDVAGAVIKGTFWITAGVIGGSIRILGGILSFDGQLVIKGILDIVYGITGAIVMLVGKVIAGLQTLIPIQEFERRLTREEIALLKRVYRDSIAFYNVRVVSGRTGLYDLNSRPFTLGNTIYLKNDKTPQTLVHECAHVWQYQHTGARYSSQAIAAQWFVEDAYSWEREIQRGNTEWVDFNNEAQAAFLEDIFISGRRLIPGFPTLTGNGAFYDADQINSFGEFKVGVTDHTDRANRGVAVVRGAKTVRPSRALA